MNALTKDRKIKVVIFDLCGVLVDVRWKNLDEILRANNVKTDKEVFKRISSDVFTLQTFKSSAEAVDVFLKAVGEQNNNKLRRYQISFLENWGKLATPNFIGITLLRYSKLCGFKIAILSNVFPVKETWKKKWGIDIVDRCFFSYENGIAKPDKRAFLNVVKFFNVKPSECLLIGDSFKKDINPAKAVGMKVLYWSDFCEQYK